MRALKCLLAPLPWFSRRPGLSQKQTCRSFLILLSDKIQMDNLFMRAREFLTLIITLRYSWANTAGILSSAMWATAVSNRTPAIVDSWMDPPDREDSCDLHIHPKQTQWPRL